MADCPKCGNQTSVWSRDIKTGICNECTKLESRMAKESRVDEHKQKTELLKQQRQAFEEQRRREAIASDPEYAKREQKILEKIHKIKEQMLGRIKNNLPVIVYHSLYLPVDSKVFDEPLNGRFDISKLFGLGLQGWEAIQIIPRTVGVGVKNASIGSTIGITWGAASGGNVDGVYVLLQKRFSASDINPDAEDELAKIIRSNINVI